MSRSARSLVTFAGVVAAVAVAACSASESSVTPRLSPYGTRPLAAKIQATDSTLMLTTTEYSDSAKVLQRLAPLATDLTVTATIPVSGGTVSIPAAGLTVTFPNKALAVATPITVTAKKGLNLVYEFGPHGTLFQKPVRIQQDLAVTTANLGVTDGLHGAYFDASPDSAYIDAQHSTIRVKENQLGYKEGNSSAGGLSFYVGHFSGYIVAMGAR